MTLIEAQAAGAGDRRPPHARGHRPGGVGGRHGRAGGHARLARAARAVGRRGRAAPPGPPGSPTTPSPASAPACWRPTGSPRASGQGREQLPVRADATSRTTSRPRTRWATTSSTRSTDACREAGIPYFLTSGTLLGAVRSGSWIPWDDDIDVIMFRDDYERLAPQIEAAAAGRRGVQLAGEPRRPHHDDPADPAPRQPPRAPGPAPLAHPDRDQARADRHLHPRPRTAQPGAAAALARHRPWPRAGRRSRATRPSRDVLSEPIDRPGAQAGRARRRRPRDGAAAPRLARAAQRVGAAAGAARVEGPVRGGQLLARHRGRKMSFEEDWYLPAGTVEFCGRTYPAPGDAAAVLTELYGPTFITPPADASERRPIHIRGGLTADLGGRTWVIEPEPAVAADAEADGPAATREGPGVIATDDGPEVVENHLSGAGFRRQVLWSLVARSTSAVLQVMILVLLARGLPPYLFAFVIAVNVVLQVAVAVNGFGLLRQIEFRRSRDPHDPSLPALFRCGSPSPGRARCCGWSRAWWRSRSAATATCWRCCRRAVAAGRADHPGVERPLGRRRPLARPAAVLRVAAAAGGACSSASGSRSGSSAGRDDLDLDPRPRRRVGAVLRARRRASRSRGRARWWPRRAQMTRADPVRPRLLVGPGRPAAARPRRRRGGGGQRRPRRSLRLPRAAGQPDEPGDRRRRRPTPSRGSRATASPAPSCARARCSGCCRSSAIAGLMAASRLAAAGGHRRRLRGLGDGAADHLHHRGHVRRLRPCSACSCRRSRPTTPASSATSGSASPSRRWASAAAAATSGSAVVVAIAVAGVNTLMAASIWTYANKVAVT